MARGAKQSAWAQPPDPKAIGDAVGGFARAFAKDGDDGDGGPRLDNLYVALKARHAEDQRFERDTDSIAITYANRRTICDGETHIVAASSLPR